MSPFNYQKICSELLDIVSPRQKEVIERRFGLSGNPPETLQSIGDDLKITRERVRQLEKAALLKIASLAQKTSCQKTFSYFKSYLVEQGGLKREDILLNDLGKGKDNYFIAFLLSLGKDFFYFPGDNERMFPFWSVEPKKEKEVLFLLQKLEKFFQEKQRTFSWEQLQSLFSDYPGAFLHSCVEIARTIKEGPLGDIGLVVWPEIKPRGVRDMAYLVLKKITKPLHFREIANEANSLKNPFFAKRKILPQTVHNELIRDPRFVLAGRGIYGLREWGYSQESVKEVLFQILQASSPLSKEEILEQVQKKKIVKPSTVLLNLADKNYFHKDQSGKYTLKIKSA